MTPLLPAVTTSDETEWTRYVQLMITTEIQKFYLGTVQPDIEEAKEIAKEAKQKSAAVLKTYNDNNKKLKTIFWVSIASFVMHIPTSADSIWWNLQHNVGSFLLKLLPQLK